MTLQRLQIQGDYNDLIQCPEISSTSGDTNRILAQFHLRARETYRSRRIPDPINSTRPFPMGIVQNLQVSEGYNGGQVKHSARYPLMTLALLFLLALCLLAAIYSTFPDMTPEERTHIKIPWNLEDAKHLGVVLDRYKEDHYYQVFLGVCMTYIFLQTFAIPGSLFLSVLSGFLFTFVQALILVCTCSALGASLCFLISQLVGRRLIFKYFPEKATAWGVIVNKHRDNLLNYVIFLRVTPFLPNWFINLTAPVIGVPLAPFAIGTFIGVAPPSFIALQAGKTLHTMSSSDSALSWVSVSLLIVFGVLSLVPIYFKDKLKRKFE